MNYYAQGGQAYGLKSLAQELPKYGRYGDSIVAHINPQEAMILKAMGGSGTINPDTGLPEYFLKGITQPFVDVWKGITNLPGIKQVSDVVTPVLQEIAPYAPYIAPFIPGVGPLLAAGIGAAGAGFGGKGRSGFDFKRGLMGGMTAYGLSNLYTGLQAAGGGLPGATTPTAVAPTSSGAAEMANVAIAEGAPTAGMVATEPGIASQLMSGEFGSAATQFGEKAGTMGTDFVNQMSNAGQGIQNLTGLGTQTVPLNEVATGSKAAFSALGKEFGTGSAGALLTGATGMADLDAQQKYLDEAKAAGSIADTEYQEGVVRIQAARKRAEEAVLANPYQFAMGGQVDDELGGDYSAMGMNQGNMQKGLFNMGYAEGGTPRFLSGGGDGMSDSIKAKINGSQEARLADGEFVIPADVVSHLGNGSSKAGAKQLYSMMDRVRSARTGRKSQGKQINPRKLMAA